LHTVAPSPEQDVTPPHERPAERAPAPLGADAPPREVWLVRVGCAVVIVLAALIVCGPMLPRKVPTHPWSDMSNHVREVHEFKLALREGQVPPIVAPEQNGQLRGPQFQYYSVTAYLLPGLFALVGVNSYRALGLGMFVQTVLGGNFFYRTGRALRLGRAASLLGATAFLLFSFVGIDLYRRGGHPEVAAMYSLPVVFFPMLRLVQTRGPRAARYFCFSALAWAYFIPIHPLHTVMGACLMLFLLAGYVLFDQRLPVRENWPRLLTPAASMAAGLAATVWFWYPIARDYGQLRVVGHQALFDAGIFNFQVLLWPFYYEPQNNEWPAQLGLHLVIAVVLALLLARRTGAVGVLAALSFVGMFAIIGWHNQIPHINELLKPLQWTYRLKIPAAFAGALCLSLVYAAFDRRMHHPWARGLALGAALGYVFFIAPPYFAHLDKYPRHRVSQIVAPGYHHPNALAYAMRGTDFGELSRLWAPDGVLRTGTDLPIAPEGYPFEARLLLRNESGGDVRVIIDGVTDRGVTRSTAPDGTLRLVIPLKPRVGLAPGDQNLRFDAPPGSAWRVTDLSFWTPGDPPDAAVRVPPASKVRRVQRRTRTVFHVDVDAGNEGLYQLPVCYLPSNGLKVNDRPAQLASVDQYLTIVRLPAGNSVVQVRTRPTLWAWWVSAATLVLTVAGAVATGVIDRRTRQRT